MPTLANVQWEPGQLQKFKLWAQREITQARADRSPLQLKWADQIAQWRAPLPAAEADFPWPGAANVELPLTAMHSDPVYSDLLQSIHGVEDIWHVRARSAKHADAAVPFIKLLTRLNQDFIHLRGVNVRAFLDLTVLGTNVYKTHWRHEVRKIRDYDPLDRTQIVERVTVRSQPKVESIPMQHFWYPANAWSIDPDAPVGAARWVAQQFFLTEGELNQRAIGVARVVEPEYDAQAVKDLIQWITEQVDDSDRVVDREIRDQDELRPTKDEKLELFELWARFDVDGDGIEEDIVVTFHEPSMRILRAIHNPFLHGRWPFDLGRLLPNFGLLGIGMAEADEWAQATASMLLNGLINNVQIANARMISVPLGADVDPDESMHPGKVWFTQPGERVESIQLGDVYQSLPQTINFLIQMSELRTGVSELRQGDISQLPSRTPATTIIETLRLGAKRFDMILSNLREDTLSNIGTKLLQLFAQYLREDETRWTGWLIDVLGEEQGAVAKDALLAIGPAALEDIFTVTVSASTAIANKEADKQSALGLTQFMSQIIPQLIELAQAIEQFPPDSISRVVAERSFIGSIQLIRFLFERFDLDDALEEDILPSLDEIEALLARGDSAGAAEGLGALGVAPETGTLEPSAFGLGL